MRRMGTGQSEVHVYSRKTEIFTGMLFTILFCGLTQPGFASESDSVPQAGLEHKIRQLLATLPYYDVFDNLTFSIMAPDTIILMGQVTRPDLKSDAEAAVHKIKGIEKVVNNIEVLPDSPSDDSIRWAAFKAIFEKPGLQKYAIQTVSPLRIIVKNGEITLDGAVASQFDKTLIEMSARSVGEASRVINNLIVHS